MLAVPEPACLESLPGSLDTCLPRAPTLLSDSALAKWCGAPRHLGCCCLLDRAPESCGSSCPA